MNKMVMYTNMMLVVVDRFQYLKRFKAIFVFYYYCVEWYSVCQLIFAWNLQSRRLERVNIFLEILEWDFLTIFISKIAFRDKRLLENLSLIAIKHANIMEINL